MNQSPARARAKRRSTCTRQKVNLFEEHCPIDFAILPAPSLRDDARPPATVMVVAFIVSLVARCRRPRSLKEGDVRLPVVPALVLRGGASSLKSLTAARGG